MGTIVRRQLSYDYMMQFYQLRFYSNSLIHILSLSMLHNNVVSLQKNWAHKGQTIIFLSGGVNIFGTCRQFFLKSNVFQTIFFIAFCNGNNFFTNIFKKCYRLFYRSYLKKKTLLVHAYT